MQHCHKSPVLLVHLRCLGDLVINHQEKPHHPVRPQAKLNQGCYFHCNSSLYFLLIFWQGTHFCGGGLQTLPPQPLDCLPWGRNAETLGKKRKKRRTAQGLRMLHFSYRQARPTTVFWILNISDSVLRTHPYKWTQI